MWATSPWHQNGWLSPYGLDNLNVVAEGIEAEAQLAFLRDERCDIAQGLLVGRPHPIAHKPPERLVVAAA